MGSPSVLYVFVDATCDGHGHNSIIPGRDEHESKTQAHSQKRQRPSEKKKEKVVQETEYQQSGSPLTSLPMFASSAWSELLYWLYNQ